MRKLYTLFAAAAFSLCAMAQTDVTKYFLSNYGFDTNYDYISGNTTSVSQELKDVQGWTADLSANYTITGTYEFGFKGKFNNASVPSAGYDGEEGGCLALSTGWSQTFNYYQNVTLPAGSYKILVPTYNGSSVTAATSSLAWIPTSGTAVKSNVSSYAINAWTLDEISFTLDKSTKGKIQIGMVAPAGSSTNSAKLCIDYVKILASDMAVDKTSLTEAIAAANTTYGDGKGVNAATLKAAIEAAQAVADDASVVMIAVLEAVETLNAAVNTYKMQNISEDNPKDCTSYITNPSFEKGTEGWTVTNLVSQTNTSFTFKAGTTYYEKWVSSGSAGSASAIQTINNLPNGVYKLTVGAQNLSQSATTKKNTGVYIYAGNEQTPVYTPGDYSVKFTNISGKVEIGYVAQNAGGNWIAVDNFRLYLIGEVDNSAVISELSRLVESAKALQSKMMSATAAENLKSKIEAAELVINGTKEYTSSTTLSLEEMMAAAETSIAEYAALQSAIDEAQKSYDESKAGAAEFLAELTAAKALVANAAATSAELSNEIAALSTAALAFNLANATPGSGTAPKVTVTNSYVVTGSTEALMRATTTGSNILERGVCWSKEHNPTVLDNRTTKSFTLNGTIFHVKGLESATVYYLRPYVMNKTYTVAYGDEVKIVTHPKGTCTWSWDGGAPTDDANTRCRNAVEETIEYFNQWTGIKGFYLQGHYGSGTPTADCSYGGWMRIGPKASYQAIGTVLHETGHGVGVGTSDRWSDANVHSWKWYGREANKIYSFLENKEANPYTSDFCMVGDGTHGWGSSASYDWFVNGADKDKHLEYQYIGGCALLYGLFVDGLCPTTSYKNGLSGYTYNYDSDKKYYLMNKDEARGLGEGLLFQRGSTDIGWKPYLLNDEIGDEAAWNIEFNANDGYYMFKNVSTGKYLTHAANGTLVSVKTINSTKSPGTTEYFQLMPDRTDVTVGVGKTKITTHGYWFTWYNGSNKAMGAEAFLNLKGSGSISQTNFNFTDKATTQQWIIISEDELSAYHDAAVATGIQTIAVDDAANNGSVKVTGIYTNGGVKLKQTQPGLNIILYSDGSSKKIWVK